MQYKWVKRIIVAVVFTFMAGTMSIPAHAEAETNTAGSTMGKETTAEDGIATYANVQEGWKQDSKLVVSIQQWGISEVNLASD